MDDMRILIVEDDFLIGELLGIMLEELGHEVCGMVATEAGAVAEAELKRPDLMICDMSLETGTGPGAVSTILKERYVPHFFVSGNVQHVRQVMPEAIVVQKPFRKVDIVSAIDQAMQQGH